MHVGRRSRWRRAASAAPPPPGFGGGDVRAPDAVRREQLLPSRPLSQAEEEEEMLQEAMRRSMADAPPARPPAPRPPPARPPAPRPPAAAAPPRRPAAGIIGARCELRVELDAGAFGRHEHPGRLCIDSRLVSLRFTLRAPAGWIANTEVELELEDASGRVPGDRTWAWRGNGQEAVRLVAGADGTYTTTRKLTVKALSSKFANRAFRLRANARVTDAQGSPGSLMNITDATEGFRVVSDTKTGKRPVPAPATPAETGGGGGSSGGGGSGGSQTSDGSGKSPVVVDLDGNGPAAAAINLDSDDEEDAGSGTTPPPPWGAAAAAALARARGCARAGGRRGGGGGG